MWCGECCEEGGSARLCWREVKGGGRVTEATKKTLPFNKGFFPHSFNLPRQKVSWLSFPPPQVSFIMYHLSFIIYHPLILHRDYPFSHAHGSVKCASAFNQGNYYWRYTIFCHFHSFMIIGERLPSWELIYPL